MKTYLLFIVVFGFAVFLAAPSAAKDLQENTLDSLTLSLNQLPEKDSTYINILIQLAIETRNLEIEVSKTYFKEAIQLSQHENIPILEIRALNGIGINYAIKDEYIDAIQVFNDALTLSLQQGYFTNAADSYNSLGIVYKMLGDYPQSLTFSAKGLEIYQSLNDEKGVATSYSNLGVLNDLMKEPELAMKNYQQALQIEERLGNQKKIAIINSNIALLYVQQNEFEKAISIFTQNLEFFKSIDWKISIAKELLNLGEAHFQAGHIEQAILSLSLAVEEADKYGFQESKINALNTLAKIHLAHGDVNYSLELAKEAQSLADSLSSLTLNSMAQNLLSLVFERMGDQSKALLHYKLYKVFEDSLYNENKANAYKAQQVLMEVAEKNNLLKEQEQQLALLNQKINLEYKWRWTLGLVCLLLLVAAGLYYQKYRMRKIYSRNLETQNNLITEQKEEIKIVNQELSQQILLREETDETINYFATSLFGKNTVEEILWDVAKNCISRLGLVDCVIYLLDESRDVLIQKAAYGNKNPEAFKIDAPIEIPMGEGIVGAVAQTGMAEIVPDTSQDPRYIIDDLSRLSELAVPLINQNKVIGVIDSEHPDKKFFTLYHLGALKTIASICASKMAQAKAYKEAAKARQAQVEAEQIKQMDLLKSQFFTNISHEFRTPLQLILGPLQKKNQALPGDELDMMKRNAQRLLRLVNQLLDLAKIEIGLLKPENRDLDIFLFLSNIADSFKPMARAKNIKYTIVLPKESCIVSIDPDKLEKIFYNLLSNAIKFTPIGGEVGINISLDTDKFLFVSVSDTGIGIPPHLQDKIFDRFYQVDGSRTRPHEGTGIGLALTRELIDLLGGRIMVQNRDPIGCRFIVTIPVPEGNGIKIPDQAETNHPSVEVPESLPNQMVIHHSNGRNSGKKNPEPRPVILLVEDNEDLRRYVQKELSSFYDIIEAPEGKSGLDLARERIPDLVVTDIMMPLMDGMDLLMKLREDQFTSHIPVILLTAREDGDSKIRGFETGAEQYLVKPFAIDELKARINSLLAQRERLRQKYSRQVTLQPKEITLNDRDASFLEDLVKVIEENLLNESFSVDQLQKEIGMSRMQLHRKLKAMTGQAASDFIRTFKLKRAAQLLRKSGIPIGEAAYLSGFGHLSYFSKCFKEQFGISPSDYARQNH